MVTTGPTVSLAPMLIQPLLEIYARVLRKDMPHTEQLGEAYFMILVDEGLIQKTTRSDVDKDDLGLEITKRGEIYIEALIATRLPIKEWIVPGVGAA